ncbi:VWA domain-containing protein [Fibrisoma montanum]|uniref:VWA domain-containing protein n=1 Tax=Fibrisoma montanum TaxID=2305895 RepID=A0A418MF93_9BACT|nr:VWA domain-containing protein [Fibrisoma montanum]RIV25472.1 VWA domain-containing protein [Fibrisoma montanum]
MNASIHKIFNLILLDESGSMESIKAATLSGFNEVVQTIKGASQQFPEQQHTVTLVTFNGLGISTRLDNQPAPQLTQLTDELFRPSASTPLYDAMGRSLMRMEWLTEKETDYTVLVSILTDGYENASREFSGPQIQALVERLKQQNWSFTYMGANHAVQQTAMSLSIHQSITFQTNEADMKDLFDKERKGRTTFYEKRSKGQSTRDAESGYFEQ